MNAESQDNQSTTTTSPSEDAIVEMETEIKYYPPSRVGKWLLLLVCAIIADAKWLSVAGKSTALLIIMGFPIVSIIIRIFVDLSAAGKPIFVLGSDSLRLLGSRRYFAREYAFADIESVHMGWKDVLEIRVAGELLKFSHDSVARGQLRDLFERLEQRWTFYREHAQSGYRSDAVQSE